MKKINYLILASFLIIFSINVRIVLNNDEKENKLSLAFLSKEVSAQPEEPPFLFTTETCEVCLNEYGQAGARWWCDFAWATCTFWTGGTCYYGYC